MLIANRIIDSEKNPTIIKGGVTSEEIYNLRFANSDYY